VDVVAALSASCVKYGMKMGIYVSPWDRNAPVYGKGEAYDDFFCAQLEELTTKYGPLYSLWFDGACGEGPNGKTQVYDWERYYTVIRKNQPGTVISVCGPDVRWIGNEAGYTRPSEWSVVPNRLRSAETTAAASQQSDGDGFRTRPIKSQDGDLGSREILANELERGGGLCWYPAETNVSIRPGWFYHPEEDGQIRSVENLLDIYEKSVGGNAVLLLNVPPDIRGRINAADAGRLRAFGERVKGIYTNNLLSGAESDCGEGIFIDDDTYWMGEGECETITVALPEARTLTHIVLCEQIRESQRIEAFTVEAETDGGRQTLYTGTTVGFKRICRFAPAAVKNIRICITQSRMAPTLRYIAGFIDPAYF
jgi:alpha-L-fucosidase